MLHQPRHSHQTTAPSEKENDALFRKDTASPSDTPALGRVPHRWQLPFANSYSVARSDASPPLPPPRPELSLGHPSPLSLSLHSRPWQLPPLERNARSQSFSRGPGTAFVQTARRLRCGAFPLLLRLLHGLTFVTHVRPTCLAPMVQLDSRYLPLSQLRDRPPQTGLSYLESQVSHSRVRSPLPHLRRCPSHADGRASFLGACRVIQRVHEGAG